MTTKASYDALGPLSDGLGSPRTTAGVEAHALRVVENGGMPAVVATPDDDLAAIYRAHHGTVWRAIRGLGVPDAWVDDATQDVFVVVQRRLQDYDGRVPLRHWILGIARKVALRHRERSARRDARHAPLEQHPTAAHQAQGEDVVAQREASDLVAEFLGTLRPDKRAVFTLVDIEGLSAVEAAELLEINLNTVYSRLRVARQRFEQLVAKHRPRRTSWNR